MYQQQEDVFYYLTLYNQNYRMPAIDENNRDEIINGIIQGGYCWQHSKLKAKAENKVHLLGSGPILQECIDAATRLEEMGFPCDIWSITSFTELTREAQDCEHHNLLHPLEKARVPLVSQWFGEQSGIVVAATDYMKALPQGIAQWMPLPYTCLGTDGFGLSEDRAILRDYFEVSSRYIVTAALSTLYQQGEIDKKTLSKHFETLGITG